MYTVKINPHGIMLLCLDEYRESAWLSFMPTGCGGFARYMVKCTLATRFLIHSIEKIKVLEFAALPK